MPKDGLQIKVAKMTQHWLSVYCPDINEKFILVATQLSFKFERLSFRPICWAMHAWGIQQAE